MKFSSFLACFVVAVICQALHAQDRVVQAPADQVLLDRTPAPVPTLISPGDMLPPWQPGMLDIHQISTGRGNAGFYILPDGTTLLVDAGEMPIKRRRIRPTGQTTPGARANESLAISATSSRRRPDPD